MSKLSANDGTMSTVRALTKEEEEALAQFNPRKELEDWSEYVNENRVYHMNTIHWNMSRRTGLIHASALANPCDKYIFMQLQHAESKPKFSGRLCRIFDTGTALQEQANFYQETRAAHFGYSYETEVEIGPETSPVANRYRLCGSSDAVSWGWPIEKPIIWELKTINLRGFQKLTSVSYNYLVQVHVYMACLDIPMAIVLYTNKNDSSLAAIKVPFREDLWRQLTKRIDRIIAMSDDFELPIGVNNSQCRECDFLEECEPELGRESREKRRKF